MSSADSSIVSNRQTLTSKMAKNKVKPTAVSTEKPSNTKTNKNLFIKNNSTKKPHPKYKKPSENVLRSKQDNKINKKVNKAMKKPRKNQVSPNVDDSKKPFDKKQWRLKRYSKKYKLEQFQEKEKKTRLTEYYKQIKDGDQVNFDPMKIYEEYGSDKEEDKPKSKKKGKESEEKRVTRSGKDEKKVSARKLAEMEYQRIQEQKKAKKEQRLKQAEERKQAILKYKKNKIEKFKKINQKTKKGQPVMKGRMELLLQKIQSTSV